MTVSRTEIEERWLSGCLVGGGTDALVETFNRVESLLGRTWLEAPLETGMVGPMIALPIHIVGGHLRALERAVRREKLIARVRTREPAALSELHALAVCVGDATDIEIEIEPPIQVDGGNRVPDFAVRRGTAPWTYVEVTAPNETEAALAARAVAMKLVKSLPAVPNGVAVNVRFREQPADKDIDEVAAEFAKVSGAIAVERANFVLEVSVATNVISISGADERDRPMYCGTAGRVDGNVRSSISVRVPYSDERGQKILDAEAKQIPKEGPGLICVMTTYAKYWRDLIERSFSPTIRRRVSGALLFHSGIVASADGSPHLPTVGELVANPHARTPLPDWLCEQLERLPRHF